PALDMLFHDLRYAVRGLFKNPGFTIAAVLTLALGIAVNATMFSLVSAFLLRRPPVRDPERVAVVSAVNPAPAFHADASSVSAPNYLGWRQANHVFEDMAAADEYRTVSLTAQGHSAAAEQPEPLRSAAVSPTYFSVLAVAHKDRSLHLFARLKAGATVEHARAEFVTLARRAEQNFPEAEKGWGATVRTLPDFLIYDFEIRNALAIMMTTVAFVLMIACANVAGLLLARAAGRRKELAIRIALGAGRLRVILQLLTEGLLIALLGGAAGLLLSYWGIQFVRASLTFNEAITAVPLSLDRNVLLFAFAVSL